MSNFIFYQLCLANEPWQLKLTQAGELIIMPSTGGESGIRNSDDYSQSIISSFDNAIALNKIYDKSITLFFSC
jgi:hypothetical protein